MSDQSGDNLDGWRRLADAIESNLESPELDLELLVVQSRHAAEGLRRLAAMAQGAHEPPAMPTTQDEVWVPDGQGGGMRVKVKPPE